MADASTLAPGATAAEPVIRRIGVHDLREALRLGVDDFLATPTQLVFLGLIYVVVGLLAARAAWGGDLLTLVFPLIAGLSLMGPVVALGVYEISRRREAGQPTSAMHAFAALRSPAIGSILALGLVLAVLFGLWVWSADVIYDATLGRDRPDSMGSFARDLLDTREGWTLILVGNLVGAGFAAIVLVLTVVSFPLLLDRDVGLGVAIRTSIRAFQRNPGTMLLWGLLVASLLLLGSLPLFVGLAVVMPVLGHATWHLYRKVVA
jgi:uncharacterized membrane protein